MAADGEQEAQEGKKQTRRIEKERERERGGGKKEEIDSPVPPPVPPVRALSAACFMSS